MITCLLQIALENDVTRAGKQGGEMKRILDSLHEQYRQIEVG